jgi:hypothetical protein
VKVKRCLGLSGGVYHVGESVTRGYPPHYEPVCIGHIIGEATQDDFFTERPEYAELYKTSPILATFERYYWYEPIAGRG